MIGVYLEAISGGCGEIWVECWFELGITLINLGTVPMGIIRGSRYNKNEGVRVQSTNVKWVQQSKSPSVNIWRLRRLFSGHFFCWLRMTMDKKAFVIFHHISLFPNYPFTKQPIKQKSWKWSLCFVSQSKSTNFSFVPWQDATRNIKFSYLVISRKCEGR